MILISFVDPWKKMHFPKCEDCSPKIKPAMVILGLNFSRTTALKMDDIKKAPCGQAPLCSSESNMSNHVRTSFVLFITVANQKIWALEIFGFSGVRKWYKNVCKTAIFQAKRLIFCVNTYFLILSTPINSVLWFLKKNLTDTSFEKY